MITASASNGFCSLRSPVYYSRLRNISIKEITGR